MKSALVRRQRRRFGLAAVDRSVDCRAAEAKLPSDRRPAEPGLQQRLHRQPVSRGHVRVVRSHFGDTVQVVGCRAPNLRPPGRAKTLRKVEPQ
jgi:hypothetical protein